MGSRRSRDHDSTHDRPRKKSCRRDETVATAEKKTDVAELLAFLSSGLMDPRMSLQQLSPLALSIAASNQMHSHQDPSAFVRGTSSLPGFGNTLAFSSLPSLGSTLATGGVGLGSLSYRLGMSQTTPEADLLSCGSVHPLLASLGSSRLQYHMAQDILRQEALSTAAYQANLHLATSASQPMNASLVSTSALSQPIYAGARFDVTSSEIDATLPSQVGKTFELSDPRNKSHLPLGIPEDQNWLSEFHCFVRDNLIEVCTSNKQGPSDTITGKEKTREKVGIRCRYCAHNDREARAKRSSAFPSSIAQLYQSFTMMLRDHFGKCTEIPNHRKKEFLRLKGNICQGSTDAKQYWQYSAAKLGFQDSEDGIIISESSRNTAKKAFAVRMECLYFW